MAVNASDIKKNGYYVPGIGYFQNEQLVTEDENGQRSVGGGVVYEGKLTKDGGLDTDSNDRLSKAYDWVKSGTSSALKRWANSRRSDNETEKIGALKELYDAYVADGRYRGTYEDFPSWLSRYMAQMQAETLPVSALHNSRGVATKTSDGRLTNVGIARANANSRM